MNKIKLLPLVVLLFSAFQMRGQQISMYKTFGGVRFTQNDTVLTDRQVSMILFKENMDAYKEFKKAKKINTLSSILGFSGGALMGIPIVTAIAGGDPEWILGATGAGLILASIPIHRAYKARTLHALDIYNEKLTGRINTRFFFAGTHAGVVIKF
jgi:hypothetical protein